MAEQAEQAVQQALEQAVKGKTVVVIAHHMSTIREADTIAVLEGGQVVEQGTHDELMAIGGRYAELDQLQRGG